MAWGGVAPNKTFTRTDGVYTGATTHQQAEAALVGIRADRMDTHAQDFATALNSTLLRDGGNSLTASIPAGGFGMTGMGVLGSVAEITVASATTTNILGAAAIFVLISGTVTITSLGTGANQFKIVRFSGALTLTHNGTSLILPGAANITTAAGDMMGVTSDGSSNARVVWYQQAARGPIASFSANKNTSNQTVSSTAATQITFGTELYDFGGFFASNAWTPPAGYCLIQANAAASSVTVGENIALTLYKNGSAYRTTQRAADSTGVAYLDINVIDNPNGSDVYTLYVTSTADTSYAVTGLLATTWFTGTML